MVRKLRDFKSVRIRTELDDILSNLNLKFKFLVRIITTNSLKKVDKIESIKIKFKAWKVDKFFIVSK